MTLFRLLLIAIIAIVGIYTVPVVQEHGLDFVTPFFGDIAKMGWPGQFNMDFYSFLILGSLWLMWRNHFSPLGLLLGLLIFAGGAPLLCAYLLFVMARDRPTIEELLLGTTRATALKGS
jgi:hypothetical protein